MSNTPRVDIARQNWLHQFVIGKPNHCSFLNRSTRNSRGTSRITLQTNFSLLRKAEHARFGSRSQSHHSLSLSSGFWLARADRNQRGTSPRGNHDPLAPWSCLTLINWTFLPFVPTPFLQTLLVCFFFSCMATRRDLSTSKIACYWESPF